jgi:hypothetical protein
MPKPERNCVVEKSERAPIESGDQPPNASERPPTISATAATMWAAETMEAYGALFSRCEGGEKMEMSWREPPTDGVRA